MKKLIISGVTYLGNVVQKKKKAYVTKAYNVDHNMGIAAFGEYVEAENLGNLEDFTIHGNAGIMTVHPLTPNQKIDLKVCRLHMEQSKTEAVRELENGNFRKRLEK